MSDEGGDPVDERHDGRAIMGWMIRAGVVLAAVVASACGAGERAGEGGLRVVRDTVGDTLIVRTVAGSAWGAPGRLVEEMRIGALEGADEYLLGDVRGLAVDREGFIYVYDAQVPALRKYAPDGTYVATFGREGGGPGEYKNSDGGLVVLPDGRVALRDVGNGRITVYASNGEAAATWPIRGSFSTSDPMVADTAGNVYTQVLLDPRADVTEWHIGLVRYGPDGVPRDTIPSPTWDYERATVVARRDGSASVNSVPFAPTVQWAFSPLGYMVGGLSTRYAIDLFQREDRVVRIERVVEPVPVGAGERANWEARVTENMRNMVPDWKWNGPPIPDEKPPFRELYVGQDGRIWVRVSATAVEIPVEEEPARPGERRRTPLRWREPVIFDVFEPDGRYLGEVRAPDEFSPYPTPYFRGEHVWAVVRDELGVQYVVRFRIEHGGDEPGEEVAVAS
ncbi:MAG TPA: hypothetical protein VF188_03555 [Longimicrobiales bacterium]